MLRLDDEECYIDEPVRSSIKQTRSLGRKQSCVRWLPECSAGAGIVATGTWDEPSNCVQLWAVALQPEDVEMDDDAAAAASEAPAARLLATAHHAASVLGLTAAGSLSCARGRRSSSTRESQSTCGRPRHNNSVRNGANGANGTSVEQVSCS